MTSGLRGARSCQSEDVVSKHTELDWQAVSLTDVSESVRYGYTASASTDEIGPTFLRITDIVPQCISWHSVPYCEGNEGALEKYLLQVQNLLNSATHEATVPKRNVGIGLSPKQSDQQPKRAARSGPGRFGWGGAAGHTAVAEPGTACCLSHSQAPRWDVGWPTCSMTPPGHRRWCSRSRRCKSVVIPT